jgi:peptidoglycan hydrolase CwlO-like protein
MPHPLINQLNILKARNAKLRDVINKLQQGKDSTIKQLEELLKQKDELLKQKDELLEQKDEEITSLKNAESQKNDISNEKKLITDELDKQNIKYSHIGDFIIYE